MNTAPLMDTEWIPDVSIGDRLRIVRRTKRRTQDDMAAALGVKTSTYSAWESGRNTPSLKEVQDIARRLFILDRVPQWWTLGADQPPANVWGAPSARSSTDRASDYGSEFGNFSRFRRPRRGERRRHLSVVPLYLGTDRAVSA